jgi:transcription initiation factor TFIID subunit 1
LLLDLNDKSQLFEYGEGPFPTPTTESKDEEKGHSSLKRSHWLAVLQSLETQTTPTGLDLFNLSNDERSNTNGGTAQPAAKFTVSHSLPALRLSDAYFSTYYTANSLRHWHRMPLRGMESHRKYTVISLLRYIEKRARERETELQANGGGELLLMRSRKDLSGKDGQLVLFEFCEEFPCVLSNVGMASKLVNYYRKRGKEGRPKFEFGALTIVSKSDRPQQYFLGELCEGQWLQSIENNLFRAPIYSHKPRITDFLLVKSKSRIYIREIVCFFSLKAFVSSKQTPFFSPDAPFYCGPAAS